MNLRKLHYISGLMISVFVFTHLINHLCSIFGASAHIEVMNRMRMVYRNVLVETVLIIAVLLQIGTGIRLVFTYGKTPYAFFDKLHVWSGLYLAFFLFVHVASVLVGRTILNLDTNFYFGVSGLNTFPVNLFFIPYYTCAIVAFFAHIAAVHRKKIKTTVLGLEVHRQSYIILWVGLAVAILILYGLTNQFSGILIPTEYKILTDK